VWYDALDFGGLSNYISIVVFQRSYKR
jgi:hypothetical protein